MAIANSGTLTKMYWTTSEVSKMMSMREDKVRWTEVALAVGHAATACRAKYSLIQKRQWTKRADRKLYALCSNVESPNWSAIACAMVYKTAAECRARYTILQKGGKPPAPKRMVWTDKLEEHLLKWGPQLTHQHNPSIRVRVLRERYARLKELYN